MNIDDEVKILKDKMDAVKRKHAADRERIEKVKSDIDAIGASCCEIVSKASGIRTEAVVEETLCDDGIAGFRLCLLFAYGAGDMRWTLSDWKCSIKEGDDPVESMRSTVLAWLASDAPANMVIGVQENEERVAKMMAESNKGKHAN